MKPTLRELPKFYFRRSRGIVWSCDVANSSRYLNDNKTANDMEEFLPRLYWTAIGLVDAAGGRFVKWTGDGFLAWLELTLHRDLGERASVVLDAAFHLSAWVNVTQLGLTPREKFRIRHGVAFEQDAVEMKIVHEGRESLDLLGRGIVLAERLSKIAAPDRFASIVVQGDVVRAAKEYGYFRGGYKKLGITKEDRLKFFKGETWNTANLHAFALDKKRPVRNLERTVRKNQRIIAAADRALSTGAPVPSIVPNYTTSFVEYMANGPPWARKAMVAFSTFVEKQLLGSLREITDHMARISGRPPAAPGRRRRDQQHHP